MKLDRLIGILAVLLQRERVTAPDLAARFEVSRRTINRDIEALCQAGIPIATRQGTNGGISIVEGFAIDKQLLTRGDMRAILAGLRGLDSVSGSNRYALLMEKLSPGASKVLSAGDHLLIDLASWYGSAIAEKIELILSAMDGHKLVCFRYHAPGGESLRAVEPGYLVFHWSSWYLWGFCRARQDYRLFKLGRMTELRAGEAFEPREVPLPELSNERAFPANFRLDALVEPEYRWRLIEEYGEDCYREMPDGRLLFSFGFTDRDEALSWMLSFRGGAELLKPEGLRDELLDIGKKLVRLYGDKEGM